MKPIAALVALLAYAAPAAAGPRLVTRLLAAPEMPGPVPVVVQLPPSYDEAPGRRYPVLYFLHDGRGNERTLGKRGLAARLDAEMAAGRLPEMLVVSPRGVGTWFTDARDGSERYGAFLDRSLVRFVDGAFRTLPRRNARAAIGISMGGYGVVRWGLRSPELLGVVGGLSPAIQQLSRRTPRSLPFFIRPAFRRAFGEGLTEGAFRRDDLASILLDDQTLAARAPRLLLRCGTSDHYRLDVVSTYFQKLFEALGGRSEVVLEPGGHDWGYWRRVFVPFVSDLFRALATAGEAT